MDAPRTRRQLLAQLTPFSAASTVGYLLALLGGTPRMSLYVMSAVLNTAVSAVAVLAPWRSLVDRAQVLLAVMSLAAVGLLHAAIGEGQHTIDLLALIPVFWTALHGTRRELAIVVTALGGYFAVPLATAQNEREAVSALLLGVLFVIVAGTLALTVQDLVSRVREEVSANRQLATTHDRLASTDALTGLPNRRGWTALLQDAVQECRSSHRPLCVAMIDLDFFKRFNDSAGHERGDQLLRAVAEAWSSELRAGDAVCRYGGEEFAALIAGCELTEAERVVDRMRIAMPLGQTCSAGIAQWDGVESGEALLCRADRALYDAKRAGRDRLVSAA